MGTNTGNRAFLSGREVHPILYFILLQIYTPLSLILSTVIHKLSVSPGPPHVYNYYDYYLVVNLKAGRQGVRVTLSSLVEGRDEVIKKLFC